MLGILGREGAVTVGSIIIHKCELFQWDIMNNQ